MFEHPTGAIPIGKSVAVSLTGEGVGFSIKCFCSGIPGMLSDERWNHR
jgi:hypothetical protein